MINGKGVYINVLNKEKENPKIERSDYRLNKYNCYIGEFEKGKFKKGKVYIFNQQFEKLTFQNEEKKKGDNYEISFEKNNEVFLVSKSTKKNGIIYEGFIININDKDKIEDSFSFRAKNDSDYIYANIDDELNEKELYNIYNKYKDNFKEYKNTIQNLFKEILEKLINFKRNLDYDKSQIKENYKLLFENKYSKILFD